MTNGNSGGDNGASVVAIVAIIVLVGLAIVFFVYILPSLQKNQPETTTQPGTKVEINTPPIGNQPSNP